MAYAVEFACLTHVGRVREINQDNYLCNGRYKHRAVQSHTEPLVGRVSAANGTLFGVFDGMGGEECGEIASYIAAKEARSIVLVEDMIDAVKAYCERANDAICAYTQRHSLHAMGTTAAMLWCDKRQLVMCNIGDSKVFRLDARSGELEQISTDHVAVAPFGKKPPLIQNLGIPTHRLHIEPSVSVGAYCRGDRYVICSDGLSDMVSYEEIADVLREERVGDSARLLLHRALENGGKDNVTLIVLEIQKETPWLFRIFTKKDDER